MDRVKEFISAILAGMCIGFAGVVSLRQDDPVIASFLFCIGMFGIVVFGLHLFTGRVGYLPHRKHNYIAELCVVWFGNLVGVHLMAEAIKLTRIYSTIEEHARILSSRKLDDTLLSILILSFFCGVLTFMAVEAFKNKEIHHALKFPAVFLPIMVFILSGYEQVVANMFYFSLVAVWDFNTWIHVIVMTIGNSLGGMFIPFYLKYFRLPISD
ncbi:MAG: formate/nitrite transporter family protein [Bacillota bacterium]